MTLLDTLLRAFEASLQPTAPVILTGLAIVLLFPILLHFLIEAFTPYTVLPTVLLAGPSHAGKTALLTLLERENGTTTTTPSSTSTAPAPAPTHTSQTPATAELSISASDTHTSRTSNPEEADTSATKKFLLIDTPGHAKLRRHALAHLSSTADKEIKKQQKKKKLRAVVFVVDAAALSTDSDTETDTAAAAAYLYDILLSLQRRARASRGDVTMPVLVAANKMDLFTALPAPLVKGRLEAEIGRIRALRAKEALLLGSAGADEVDNGGAGKDDSEDWLGEYGSKKFSFAQMAEFGVEVDVLGGNVVGEGPGVDRWWKWIADKV